MEDSLTNEARDAVEWAVEHARPGSNWRWEATLLHEDVYFTVVTYDTLGHPEVGCVLEIGAFRVLSPKGGRRLVTPGELPVWYHQRQRPLNLLSALKLMWLVDKGEITPRHKCA